MPIYIGPYLDLEIAIMLTKVGYWYAIGLTITLALTLGVGYSNAHQGAPAEGSTEVLVGEIQGGNATDPNTKLSPSDSLDITGDRFNHNTQMIAEELSSLNSTQISQYPITELSADDLGNVLGNLDYTNLAKVLLNIPQDDLTTIKNMLSPSEFAGHLNNLPVENRTEVINRLNPPANNTNIES